MRYFAALVLIPSIAYADSASNGPLGINSGWTLPGGVKILGQGVGLGQVENFRPGKPGFDVLLDYNVAVKPFAVYNDGLSANPGDAIDNHPISVAGVMIADSTLGASYAGVAPMASLHSSATVPNSLTNDDIITATHNLLDPSETPRVRDLNYSFGRSLTGFDVADGNEPLTQYVDWEAYRNDNLIVVGGPVDYQPDIPSPSDNFNGITVGGSTKMEPFFGEWNQVADYMLYTEGNDADGDRVSVDLLAPGQFVAALERENGVDSNGRGTSLAAPHVTGALAHLRQYGNHFIDTIGGNRWDTDRAHRHEVMKAVLLNSADKLAGIHGSSRDIYLKDGVSRWQDTQAALDISVPLDQEMGAGHLNVRNAIRQYRTGEWDGPTVPNIGWDYGTVGGDLSYTTYEFNRPLGAGEVVAATLC